MLNAVHNIMVPLSQLLQPLSKKIPENPKYKHIKSTIDTGTSTSCCMTTSFVLYPQIFYSNLL